jgi:hypothetical protein
MDYVDDVVGISPNQAHVNPWKAIRLVPCSNTILLVEACDDETNWEVVVLKQKPTCILITSWG